MHREKNIVHLFIRKIMCGCSLKSSRIFKDGPLEQGYKIILMFFELVFFTVNNGKRTQWSLIWSAIIPEINTQESDLFNQQYDWSRKRKTQISSVHNLSYL